MSENPGNTGDYKTKQEVAAALLDERISDAKHKNNNMVPGSPGSMTTRRTLPSSHDEVFTSPTKSIQDVSPLPKADRRVDLRIESPLQLPSGHGTFRGGSPAGALQKTGNQESVKSSLRRSGGPFHLGGTQALLELEERIAQKMATATDEKNKKELVGPQEQAPPPLVPAPSKNARAVGGSTTDPSQKKDLANTVSKMTGIPPESLAKVAGTKMEANGIYVSDDADLEDPAGKLAVAVAITDDDDDVFIPAAIEYDPDAKPPMIRNRRFRLYSLLGCTLLLVMVGGLAVLFTHQKNDNPQDGAASSPAEDVSITEDSARPDANGIIEQLERIVGSEVLGDVDGAHFRAKEWLLYEDPMQLSSTDSNLVQRYLLAVVYFKLHEDGDWLSCNAPSEEEPDDFCLYQRLVNIFPNEYRSVPWYRWLSGQHECNWAGLACDDFDQLRSIDMTGQDIKGTLPTEFVSFDYLQDISLSWNKIRGTIPSEYGKMRHLLSFVLHYNQLTGSVPIGWSRFMTLQVFNVAANMLTGSIPKDFFSMSSLKGLFLYENMLTGTFPSELSQMNRLSYIRMHRNFFTGTLPTEIGLLSPRELWLYRLPLTGPIPSEIGNMGDMLDLRLHTSALTGPIPEELWNLTALSRLDLFNTQLSGTLSPNVSKLSDLVSLRVHNSSFAGTIPGALAYLPSLVTVRLDGNNFVGTVPYGFCVHKNIKELAADCLDARDTGFPQVTCTCCHICCDHESGLCDDQE